MEDTNKGLGSVIDNSKKEIVDVNTKEVIGKSATQLASEEGVQDQLAKIAEEKAAEILENEESALSDDEIIENDKVEKSDIEIKHPDENVTYQPSDEELLKGVTFKSYKSNKAIDAACIAGFSIEGGEEYVVTTDPEHPDLLGGAIHVPTGYIAKHNLTDGDYITKHKDGHYGYCPKKVFERDYDEVAEVGTSDV
jgi:hypothetical protein